MTEGARRYRVVRVRDDRFEHRKVDAVEIFEVQASDADGVFAEAFELCSACADAVGL
ncbi:MAG TPA: hypothetical protein VIJ18_11635 [Microbacteriaceae bacterium]